MSDIFIYLCLTLPYVALSIVIWVLRRDLRRTILIAAVIGAILGLVVEWWYLVDYWRPPTILGPARQSVEDVLFGASSTVIAVTAAAFFLKEKLKPVTKSSLKKITLLAIVIFGLMLILTALGVNSIIASSGLIFLAGVYTIIRVPKLLRGALLSGTVLVILTFVTYSILFGIISPHYIEDYFLLTGEPWNPTLFSFLPVAEVIWYFSAGFSLSALYHLVTDSKTGTLQPQT